MAREKTLLARDLRRNSTHVETMLWPALRGRRLGGVRFRRQQVIAGFIADFYCAAAGLVIEVDGPVHAEQTESDAARDSILAAHHLAILRVTNAEVQDDLGAVLHRIQAAVEDRGHIVASEES